MTLKRMDDGAAERNALDWNYRKLLASIIVVAVQDLAFVRLGRKIEKIGSGQSLSFGNSLLPYPRPYFRKLGLSVGDSPKTELEVFFESEYFQELAMLLEPTLGFRLSGKGILRRKHLENTLENLKRG